MNFTEQVWWYTTRSAGIISWGLLTLSILWGLMLSTKVMGKVAPAAGLLDLHRYLSMLSVSFVAVHVAALVPDTYVHFGWAELFVPMKSEWKAGAIAWGIVALYLLIAVEVTSLFMRKIPRKFWRMVHFSSFLLWIMATVHTIQAGTDTGHRYFLWAAILGVQFVLFFTVVRTMTARRLKRALKESGTQVSVDDVRAQRLAEIKAKRQGTQETSDEPTETTARLAKEGDEAKEDDEDGQRIPALTVNS